MKLVAKKDLVFKDGFIYDKKNKEVCPLSWQVIHQANVLAKDMDIVNWLKDQPKFCPGPDYRAYWTEVNNRLPEGEYLPYLADPDTPLRDKSVEESHARFAEMKEESRVHSMNIRIAAYAELFKWIADDEVVIGEGLPEPLEINILELEAGDVVAMLEEIQENQLHIAQVRNAGYRNSCIPFCDEDPNDCDGDEF